jgi:hypothetical protein
MRGATQIGLFWTEGAHNGGTSVLDFSLWFDSGNGVYVLLQPSIELRQYLAKDLTTGQTYKFKVQARNEFGFGAFSAEA